MSNLKEVLKEKSEQNYFEVLGVSQDASAGELRKARRALLTQYHPDKYEGEDKKTAEEIGSLVNLAYEALSDSTFVEKYIATEFRAKYRNHVTNLTEETAVRSMTKTQRKGSPLTALAQVSPTVLRQGARVKIEHQQVPGKEVADRSRVIDIPPNTKTSSILIYEGLGEVVEEGVNGDLLVYISTEGHKVTESDKLRSAISADVVVVELNKITSLGVNKIDAPKVVSQEGLEIELFKENNSGNLIFIKEAGDLGKSLLITY